MKRVCKLCRWLFRHVVKFLRDGALPDEDRLLAQVIQRMQCLLVFIGASALRSSHCNVLCLLVVVQIYREASFWKLSTLKRAIESNKVRITR